MKSCGSEEIPENRDKQCGSEVATREESGISGSLLFRVPAETLNGRNQAESCGSWGQIDRYLPRSLPRIRGDAIPENRHKQCGNGGEQREG
jgi:hypothetical protein